MRLLNQGPRIMLENTSETAQTIFFAPAEIDSDAELYRHLAGDLHEQTAGAITVHLDEISYGKIAVQMNPALGNLAQLASAVDAMTLQLKKACARCAEYDPGIYDRE